MPPNRSSPALRHVSASRAGSRITPGENPALLAEEIDAGRLIVFRSVFSSEEMHATRQGILDWAEATDEWPAGKSASQVGLNFHRTDDGTAPTTMPHIFRQFGFGTYETLPEPLRGQLVTLRDALIGLQNLLAGTDIATDSKDYRLKALQHPCGGGYLVPHRHPYEPQKVATFLNLSEPGIDYHSGGARFRPPGGEWIDTFDTFRIGDLLAWRYDMVHDVSPCDPGQEIDWQADDGLWIAAAEMVEAHGKSHVHEG